jgi:hypothetical protein
MGWGHNENGELGVGHTTSPQTSPTKLSISNPIYISPSNSYSYSSFFAIPN